MTNSRLLALIGYWHAVEMRRIRKNLVEEGFSGTALTATTTRVPSRAASSKPPESKKSPPNKSQTRPRRIPFTPPPLSA